MCRIFQLLILIVSVVLPVKAQKLSPEFELASSDLTACLHPRKDMNDRNCALVKVQFVGEVLDIEGNVVQPLDKHNNEVWVYMPQNSRQIKVITKNFLPIMVTFANFGVEKLESNRTYVLVLNQNGNVVQTDEHVTQLTQQKQANSIDFPGNKSGSTITIPVKGGGIKMVRVEAGSFLMGDTSDENENNSVHKVTLTKDYYIGECEVTQAVWEKVMGNNPSYFKDSKCPVENISWYDCQEFISKLNSLTGINFRLPTEAEWEFAARGGNKTREYLYSGSDNISDVGWSDEFRKPPHQVMKKKANELGLYDMSGNVYEWCQDWDGDDFTLAQTNPVGAINGESKVIRGGCVVFSAKYCKTSFRLSTYPTMKDRNLGSRLALSSEKWMKKNYRN